MAKKLLNMVFLLIVGCSIGSRGVYIEEMVTKPTIKLNGDSLTVTTSNSFNNSALLIYEVNVSIDHNGKKIYLSAEQALGNKYKTSFIVDLSSYKIDDATTFEFYWIDPDKKSTKMEITKVVN